MTITEFRSFSMWDLYHLIMPLGDGAKVSVEMPEGALILGLGKAGSFTPIAGYRQDPEGCGPEIVSGTGDTPVGLILFADRSRPTVVRVFCFDAVGRKPRGPDKKHKHVFSGACVGPHLSLVMHEELPKNAGS